MILSRRASLMLGLATVSAAVLPRIALAQTAAHSMLS